MDETEPTDHEKTAPKPGRAAVGFDVTDLAAFAPTFDAGEAPAVALIGLLILVPLVIVNVILGGWPLAARLGRLLDYRRYMSGAGW